jgi:hypothetical protein
LRSLEAAIRKQGFSVQSFTSAEGFIAEEDPPQAGCVLVDPSKSTDGDVVLRWWHESGSLLSIVLISGLIESSDLISDERTSAPIVKEPHLIAALLTMVSDGLAGSLSRNVIQGRSGN